MKILNYIKKFQKVSFFIGLLIVGCIFLGSSVLPYIMPDVISTDDSLLNGAIGAAAGLAAIIFAVINIRKGLSTSVDEMNYFDKVDTAAADPETVEAIRNSTEEAEEYYFYFCGKLNQSYIMETADRRAVIEFNCDKIGVVNDYIYTIRNHDTGKEETHRISHTVTSEYGDGPIEDSHFKIDGKNNWDYMADMGYSVKPVFEMPAWSFEVSHLGIQVGEIKAAGSNILPQYEGKGGLRNVPMNNGIYRIFCRPSDVQAFGMIAFIVSRVQIV